MKIKCTLSVLAVVALTQTGCATKVTSLPLQAALQQTAPASDVALYFGSQDHPAVKTQLGAASESARIARRTGGPEISCNEVLAQALQKLRTYAHDHNGNAVINIKTSFHTTETASPTDFTCGVSMSAAAVRVRGDVVVLETK